MPRLKPAPKAHERRHGEGSITEAAPGIWRAWRPPDAENRRISQRFTSREAAHRWLVGEPEPAVLYVGAHIERWLALRAPTLRGRTPLTYQQFLGYAWDTEAAIAGIPLAALTTEDCQAWLNELLKAHTRYSVKTTRNMVGSAIGSAVPHLLAVNPMKATRLPRAEERPAKAWTRSEVGRLLDAACGTSQAAWFSFALGTGLRLGELRALLWSDIDLERMTVRVSKSVDNNTREVGPTKTGRSRTVDIPEELRAVLVEHKARQKPGERHVFGRNGRPHNPVTYRYWLRRTCLRAGVLDAEGKTLGVHSTRHTFASLALADPECHIPDVSHALGHASMATTLSIYQHFLDHEQRRTAKALGRVFASPNGELHRDLHREAAATR